MVGKLDDLYQLAPRTLAGQPEAAGLDLGRVPVVELVAVAVALLDLRLPVGACREAAGLEGATVGAEPHGAALLDHPRLIGHQVDDLLRRLGVELARIGLAPAHDMARELDGRDLHAEAEPEVGNAALARVLGGQDLALDAALAEAAGDHHPVHVAQELLGAAPRLDRLALDPAEIHAGAVRGPGVDERLDD